MARAPVTPFVPPFGGDIDQRLSAIAFAMATRDQMLAMEARVTALEAKVAALEAPSGP